MHGLKSAILAISQKLADWLDWPCPVSAALKKTMVKFWFISDWTKGQKIQFWKESNVHSYNKPYTGICHLDDMAEKVLGHND